VQRNIFSVVAVMLAPVPVITLVNACLVSKAHYLIEPNGSIAVAKYVLFDFLGSIKKKVKTIYTEIKDYVIPLVQRSPLSCRQLGQT